MGTDWAVPLSTHCVVVVVGGALVVAERECGVLIADGLVVPHPARAMAPAAMARRTDRQDDLVGVVPNRFSRIAQAWHSSPP